MKRILFLCLTAIAVSGSQLHAQSSSLSDFMANDKSLFEEVTGIKKKTDKFNLYLNMHGDFGLKWNDGFDGGAFQMKQLRIEMKGDINDWLSYRYRQRLNRGNNGAGNIDNLPTSIDIAGIGVKLKNGISFFGGKQSTAYGGIDFDLNPIEIYEYPDLLENMSNFMTGLTVAYTCPYNQQIQFQVLNSLNGPSKDMYGDLEATKLPLVYTLNWNGNFMDVFKTRWSASIMNETKGEKMYYYALGNEFNFSPKWHAYFDWMYSREGVDRKGIITNILGADLGHNAFNAEYMAYVLHVNYRFAPKWNLFAKGMYETASVSKATEDVEKGKYRTSWGYIGGVEYYPMKDDNLHFFLTYVGRSYNYTGKAKALGNENYNTNRVSLGFIWQMPVF